MAADEKFPVLNGDNLTIPIQMQLSQKQKTISQVFAVFLKCRLNIESFEKNVTLRAFVFPKLCTLKRWLDKCIKSSASQDA